MTRTLDSLISSVANVEMALLLSPGQSRETTLDDNGLCLLSLDGGGVRDSSTLYILKSLMNQLNHVRQQNGLAVVRPCEVFDLVGGTSTGGKV